MRRLISPQVAYSSVGVWLTGRLWMAVGLALVAMSSPTAAQPPANAPVARDVLIEVYYRPGVDRDESILEEVKRFAGSRRGIQSVARDVNENDRNRQRLSKIAAHYKADVAAGPVVYGCNQLLFGAALDANLQESLGAMVRVDLYTRIGCDRCRAAKEQLPKLLEQFPGFELRIREITRDAAARTELQELSRKHAAGGTSVPVLHYCNQLLVGFDASSSTPERLFRQLQHWTVETAPRKQAPEVAGRPPF